MRVFGTVLSWFRSYLVGRGYVVAIDDHKSEQIIMTCGVPQGSILGPLLFNLYVLPHGQIIRDSNAAYHSYADDTIYLALSASDYGPLDSVSA